MMEANKWKSIAIVLMVITGLEAIVLAYYYPKYNRFIQRFEPRKDPEALPEALLKDLPPESEQVYVLRHQDKHHVFVTEISTEAKVGAKVLGRIFKKETPPLITVPLYLCKSVRNKIESLFLHREAVCPAQGQNVHTQAVGYAAKRSATGLIPLYRCFGPKRGIYHSHNSICESPDDEFDGIMGFIKAP